VPSTKAELQALRACLSRGTLYGNERWQKRIARRLGLDKESGAILWSYSTGVAISGGIMTYAVDGKQYIAVQAGSDGGPVSDAPGEQRALGGVPILFVFGLPG
jgi:hypothetical protein